MSAADQPRIGVREQRKLETGRRLLEAATTLFQERGFDEVTVAEIAATAGVSAKTLFQHFPTKEDLLIAELAQVHEEMLDTVRHRDPGMSPLDAVTAWTVQRADASPDDVFDRWMRMAGTDTAVASVRRRLYDEWENALVAVLADDANEARATPRTRLTAAQLICMVRVLTSPEVRNQLERYPPERRKQAFTGWVLEAAGLLAGGFAGDTPPAGDQPGAGTSAGGS